MEAGADVLEHQVNEQDPNKELEGNELANKTHVLKDRALETIEGLPEYLKALKTFNRTALHTAVSAREIRFTESGMNLGLVIDNGHVVESKNGEGKIIETNDTDREKVIINVYSHEDPDKVVEQITVSTPNEKANEFAEGERFKGEFSYSGAEKPPENTPLAAGKINALLDDIKTKASVDSL